jgi:hypothetical protein
MGIWRLKVVRGDADQGMCPICSKEEGWRYILRCDRTRSWRDELVGKRFTSIAPEIGIRRIVTNKNKDKFKKIGLHLRKYKEKWKILAKKNEDVTGIN